MPITQHTNNNNNSNTIIIGWLSPTLSFFGIFLPSFLDTKFLPILTDRFLWWMLLGGPCRRWITNRIGWTKGGRGLLPHPFLYLKNWVQIKRTLWPPPSRKMCEGKAPGVYFINLNQELVGTFRTKLGELLLPPNPFPYPLNSRVECASNWKGVAWTRNGGKGKRKCLVTELV